MPATPTEELQKTGCHTRTCSSQAEAPGPGRMQSAGGLRAVIGAGGREGGAVA